MKPHIIFSFMILVNFSVFAQQPKVEIKDAKKNFGFVKKGDVVKENYEVTNKGNAPLLLKDVQIGCSCTTATFDIKPILPGHTTTVTIIFDTEHTYDRQDRTVLLHSNDPKSPHKLSYKGVVLRP
jgi:hypothetical protein